MNEISVNMAPSGNQTWLTDKSRACQPAKQLNKGNHGDLKCRNCNVPFGNLTSPWKPRPN